MASEAVGSMRPAEVDGEEEEERDGYYPVAEAAERGIDDVLPRLLALEAGGAAVTVAYRNPGGALVGSSGEVLVEGDQDTLVLRMPLVGTVSISPQAQHRGAGIRDWQLVSGTLGGSPTVLGDEAAPQGSNGDGEDKEDYEDDEGGYEQHEEEGYEDEAGLKTAIEQRRAAQFAHYISYMLRPIV